jgi:hypothetical protein
MILTPHDGVVPNSDFVVDLDLSEHKLLRFRCDMIEIVENERTMTVTYRWRVFSSDTGQKIERTSVFKFNSASRSIASISYDNNSRQSQRYHTVLGIYLTCPITDAEGATYESTDLIG